MIVTNVSWVGACMIVTNVLWVGACMIVTNVLWVDACMIVTKVYFHGDMISYNWVTLKPNFHQI